MRPKLQVALHWAVKNYLEACFRNASMPHVGELARSLGVCRDTLSTRFREAVGVTLQEYFKREQLAAAQELLVRTSDPIASVAQRSGFAHERTLYRFFQQHAGVTSTTFRQRAMSTQCPSTPALQHL